jgi:glutamyl-tRNA reductase
VILVVGLSHRTAPVEIRERFAAGGDVLATVLARLSAKQELGEVVFLSTCNRVEVLATPRGRAMHDPAARLAARSAVRDVLASHAGATERELLPYLYEKEDEDAVRHVFRVAASLDSMVVGEPQILGQVKSAYEAAVAAGTLKGYLGRCVHRAFTTAKRVRTETALGTGTVSIASVAVDLARHVFGDLGEHSVLLVGAGEMAEAAAKSLGRGAKSMRIVNRSEARAASLASDIGAGWAPWQDLEKELAAADVVVTSTSSPKPIVTVDLVKRVMKARRGRTQLFVDIAVPRNVEGPVHRIDNVYVFDVDDLEQQVKKGLEARKSEIVAADGIVAAEVQEFIHWSRGLDVTPTIVALRARTKAILGGELERSLSHKLKHLGEEERAALALMVESATNKLLHVPTTRLRDAAAAQEDAGLIDAAVRLFDLPSLEDGEGEREDDEAGPTVQ